MEVPHRRPRPVAPPTFMEHSKQAWILGLECTANGRGVFGTFGQEISERVGDVLPKLVRDAPGRRLWCDGAQVSGTDWIRVPLI